MMPNFEPQIILPRLRSLVRPSDYLLASANLSPGADYAAGIQKILPLYDNDLTRDWLVTFLLNLGVERDDGVLRFVTEESPADSGLKRVAAFFHFVKPRQIVIDRDRFELSAGEAIRLFFSYRHTPALMHSLFSQHGLRVEDQWITRSQEEGVFLAAPA